MAKDLAIVLNNGGINSLVATALAAQRHRLVMLHAETAPLPGSRVRAAYDLQAAHFKPYREHTLSMPFLAPLMTTGSAQQAGAAAAAADPRQSIPVGPQVTELLPLLAAAARYAAHYSASSIYIGLRVGLGRQTERGGGEELAQATEYIQVWNELLQLPCGLPELDIMAPLLELEPWQVIDLGTQAAAPFEKTWSCVEELSEPCWACRGCRSRQAAFQQAGKPDPLRAAAQGVIVMMWRRIAALSLCLLAWTAGTSAAAPATQPATRPAVAARAAIDLPKSWAGATYDYISRAVSGKAQMRNERVKLDGREVLKLTDEILLIAPDGRKLRMTYITWCEADRMLTPIRITGSGKAEGDGADKEMGALDIRFQKDKAVGTLRGKPVSMDVARPVVTELTLFRLVTLMPLKEGSEITFHGMQCTEARFHGKQTLKCAGKERIKLAGREYEAWRFDHTGAGTLGSTYWVNRDGFFLKALLDGAKEWVYTPGK